MSLSLFFKNFVFPFVVWLFFIIWWTNALMFFFLVVVGVGKVTKGSSWNLLHIEDTLNYIRFVHRNKKLWFHLKTGFWGKNYLLSISSVNLWSYELIKPPHVHVDLLLTFGWPWWQTLHLVRPKTLKPAFANEMTQNDNKWPKHVKIG